MTKWHIKMFMRLHNETNLNCIIICHANSGQFKIEHFKLKVDLVQALLIKDTNETKT